MKNARLIVLAVAAGTCAAALAAGPEDYFRGKMKPGMYEYKMQINMGAVPGMPPGMGTRETTTSHCVTDADIQKGAMGHGGRDGKMKESCRMSSATSGLPVIHSACR